jgi:hypothetical protein
MYYITLIDGAISAGMLLYGWILTGCLIRLQREVRK